MDKARLEEACKQLHLSHIPQAMGSNTSDTKEDWLIFLLENELKCRERLKTMRLFKQAKIPVQRTLDNYEWHEHIQLPNSTTKDELTSLSFIRQKENAVFVGTPGTGKTHLACALGQMATQAGIETRFWRVSDLVGELETRWKNNTLEVFKRKFDKLKLIILDEMGYVPFTKEGAELLFQLISDWYETKSIILTSNLEFSQWNKVFVDPRLTAALVDRLIHHAHILSFTGESFRLKNALSKSK
ncbi:MULTISPECIES: IS21-like element helper ATPase IstB [Enterococcus]|uniref:IS21-like element helper ATPase IstB n=1 Tax=Enterococcus TaxID=1350 RepID=UPI001C11096E|nr:IS21-like element helper ATPase IstB [Enterococcus raffinosus]MBU5363672.1 IS21-like element helper ATPase IstB [Enterococcus raffinosus]